MNIIDAFYLKTDLQTDYSVNILFVHMTTKKFIPFFFLTKHLLWIHKDFKVKPSFHALFSLCKCLHNLWKENKSLKICEEEKKKDLPWTYKGTWSLLYTNQLCMNLRWRQKKIVFLFCKKKKNEIEFWSNVLIVENVSYEIVFF